MSPHLVVLSLSDSFSEFWQSAAATADAVKILKSIEEITAANFNGPVVVSAPTFEETLSTTISELLAAGASKIAVVGTDTSYRNGIRLIQQGANEYFAFPSDALLCQQWIATRLEEVSTSASGERFTEHERLHFDFSNILGRSPLLRAALGRTSRIIRGNAAILITGETGTG